MSMLPLIISLTFVQKSSTIAGGYKSLKGSSHGLWQCHPSQTYQFCFGTARYVPYRLANRHCISSRQKFWPFHSVPAIPAESNLPSIPVPVHGADNNEATIRRHFGEVDHGGGRNRHPRIVDGEIATDRSVTILGKKMCIRFGVCSLWGRSRWCRL